VKYADREEMDRCGGVEIRSDCAVIVARVLNAGKLEEKTARRLGFEVVEFARSIEAGVDRGME
jgi:HMG box factor